MRRVALALAAILLADPCGVAAAPSAHRPADRAVRSRTVRHVARPQSRLATAQAAMSALMQDPDRRRYRDNWERAIAELLAAARGKDAPAALMGAARAQYALYRWSADEADRDRALALAGRAARAGSREAASLAAVIRREGRGNGTPRTAAAAARPIARPSSRLVAAQAAMKALMQDRNRRRFRHHWERAIAGLLAAARGKDAPAALLDAARARYALYRWSADDADRDRALALAGRAARAGSREAASLAAAIRREAGDDHPAVAAAAKPPAAAGTAPEPGHPEESEPDDEDAPPDPALEAAVAGLSGGDHPQLALGESSGDGPATVSEVRSWSNADYTRVAIYLSQWVGWQKLELAPQDGLPRRLALDFRPATLTGKALERPISGDQVDRVRAAQNDPHTVRVVLDLPGDDRVQLFSLDDPPRLIVDVGTHEAIRNVASGDAAPATPTAPGAPTTAPATPPAAGAPPTAPASPEVARFVPPPAPPPAPAPAAPRNEIRRIVVDAGHGGHDPGAIGPRRVREKIVTLAMARRLATRLRAAGFQVVLTRNDDRYLALEERTAIANTARGDLFVSIHANAHPRRARSGIETYFLNVADNRYAARLAARENGLDIEDGMGDVTRILTDLDAKASADASRRLAQLVQREVCGGVRSRIGVVHDLGVKSALFYVLLGARMPAVLVETAFISNRVEERRLTSARYQDEVAAGIARAVTTFARGEDRLASVR